MPAASCRRSRHGSSRSSVTACCHTWSDRDMKVLVADKFEQSGLDALKAAGCDVIFQPEASGDTLIAAIKKTQAPVLVVRSTQVSEAMLDAGALSLIVRAGAGVNTIDVAA